MMKSDLHIHSQYSSDGELSIESIIRAAEDAACDIIAITDHDTVRGSRESVGLASGMDILPGIEIDCNYKGTYLHLLGYGIDLSSTDFDRLEEGITRQTRTALEGWVEKMNACGFLADKGRILEAAGDKLPTQELIAEVLLSDPAYHTPALQPYLPGGSRSDMPLINFYLDWFQQGRPAYVPIDYMPFDDAVHLVRDNGGIPIVAHPGLNFAGRETIAEELLENGAEGLECFNNYHDTGQAEYFADICIKNARLMTCGSDFHGKIKPRIKIGNYINPGIYRDILNSSVMRMLRGV